MDTAPFRLTSHPATVSRMPAEGTGPVRQHHQREPAPGSAGSVGATLPLLWVPFSPSPSGPVWRGPRCAFVLAEEPELGRPQCHKEAAGVLPKLRSRERCILGY